MRKMINIQEGLNIFMSKAIKNFFLLAIFVMILAMKLTRERKPKIYLLANQFIHALAIISKNKKILSNPMFSKLTLTLQQNQSKKLIYLNFSKKELKKSDRKIKISTQGLYLLLKKSIKIQG